MRPGRPASDPDRVLQAADRLFAGADVPGRVTMEAIAAASGVGKGTVFRAFGSREGLLDALWTRRVDGLRAVLEGEAFRTASIDGVVHCLDQVLSLKLESRGLIRALGVIPGFLQSASYLWMHGLLKQMIVDAVPSASPDRADYVSHLLLFGLQVDLIDAMMQDGLSIADIRTAQAATVRAILVALGTG